VQQVADRAGRAAPSADGHGTANWPVLGDAGTGRRPCRRTARVLAYRFIHTPSLKVPRSVRFTAEPCETAGQKVDKGDIYAGFRVSACVKRQWAVGCVRQT
jgi:hypothetical protein